MLIKDRAKDLQSLTLSGDNAIHDLDLIESALWDERIIALRGAEILLRSNGETVAADLVSDMAQGAEYARGCLWSLNAVY